MNRELKSPQTICNRNADLEQNHRALQKSLRAHKNPAVTGRNLEYYRYDGKGIRGTARELTRIMESVSVEEIYTAIAAAI